MCRHAARFWIGATLAAVLAAASPARADKAYLWLDQSFTGHSNLFRTQNDEEGDGSYEIRPRIGLRRDSGEVNYLVEYSPSYDVYFRNSSVDGFDQFGRADVSYAPTETGRFFMESDFAYYRSVRSESVDGADGIPEVVARVSGRVFRAIVDMGYERQLTPTTVARGAFGIQAYDYSTANNIDSVGFGGELSIVRAIREFVSVGGLLSTSHRRFDDRAPQPASHNTVLYSGAILRVLPTPTISLELEAGPAVIFTHQDSGKDATLLRYNTRRTSNGLEGAVFRGCGSFEGDPLLNECPFVPSPQLEAFTDERVDVTYKPGERPGSRDDENFTAFARAEIRLSESWGGASVGYFRTEEASSGSGASSVRDSLTTTLLVKGGTRWSARLRGNWNRRKTVDDVTKNDVRAGASSIPAGQGATFAESDALLVVGRNRREINQYWVDLTLARQLLPRLSVELSGRFLHQDRDRSDGGGDFDNVSGRLMFRFKLPELDYPWW